MRKINTLLVIAVVHLTVTIVCCIAEFSTDSFISLLRLPHTVFGYRFTDCRIPTANNNKNSKSHEPTILPLYHGSQQPPPGNCHHRGHPTLLKSIVDSINRNVPDSNSDLIGNITLSSPRDRLK